MGHSQFTIVFANLKVNKVKCILTGGHEWSYACETGFPGPASQNGVLALVTALGLILYAARKNTCSYQGIEQKRSVSFEAQNMKAIYDCKRQS
jgi:hypothetical protein